MKCVCTKSGRTIPRLWDPAIPRPVRTTQSSRWAIPLDEPSPRCVGLLEMARLASHPVQRPRVNALHARRTRSPDASTTLTIHFPPHSRDPTEVFSRHRVSRLSMGIASSVATTAPQFASTKESEDRVTRGSVRGPRRFRNGPKQKPDFK